MLISVIPDNTKNCLTLASNTVVKSKIIGAPIVYKDTKITIPGRSRALIMMQRKYKY